MDVHLAAPGRMPAPGTEIFEWGPLLPGGPGWLEWLTKPVLIIALSAGLVCGFFWAAFRRPVLVPRGMQNVGELVYIFVREQIARPMLGRQDAERWMPFLMSVFSFVLVMNVMGVVPVLQFPVTSHFAVPLVLAVVVYVLYLSLSVRHQGFFGYFKNVMFPPGQPWWVYLLLAPIELLQHLVLRPATHSIRLFANMFAGHLLIAFFATVAWWFLLERPSAAGLGVGLAGAVMTVVLTAFEMFVQVLQAYIFTLLAASYIGTALHPDH
ncbi:ATP synthase F0 subcomplex A subunit [Thermomonospora echinospora]|uniref:ATP synthase subunit a n=1 Tax=Thermomonospora echinospora TaxID=1992 RepID=A0A1H5VIG7_9ACTN|nr:F0F1 ATP synthase subunit A [Thermomonospora echinospora]SEF87034.1 ATP synthase F0 subcomplex A subunit [Thermomonospora echinospora]